MADDQVNPPSPQSEDVQTSETQTPETQAPETQVPQAPVEATQIVPVHTRVASHQEIAWFYAQRFGLQSLLFLQFVWTLLSQAASTTQTVSMNVVRSLQTQLYVFFQGSPFPYRAQTTTLAGPGIAPIEWYYNADTKVFLSSTVYNSTNEYQAHHLQWLTGEVKYNDLVLYDVSEFLQQVKWAGTERPTPVLVLAAWSIHSGIVLNLRDGLVLKTINEDGTESSLPLRG